MWDLIVSVPDHCLSFYFADTLDLMLIRLKMFNVLQYQNKFKGPPQYCLFLAVPRRGCCCAYYHYYCIKAIPQAINKI